MILVEIDYTGKADGFNEITISFFRYMSLGK